MSKLSLKTVVTTIRLIETAHDGYQLAETTGEQEPADIADTLISAAVLGLRHREVKVPSEVAHLLDRLAAMVRSNRRRRLDNDEEASG